MTTTKLLPHPSGHKRMAVVDAITKLARELGPGARLPRVRELCDSLKVSTATLDRVLLELEQSRIIDRQHGRGIFVANSVGQTTIGFVFGGDFFGVSPFWGQVLENGQALAAKRNFGFRYYLDIPESGKSIATHGDLQGDLEARRLNALAVFHPRDAEEIPWLSRWNLPMVVAEEANSWKYRAVFDRRLFVNMAVEQLVARGCKRIGFLGSTEPYMAQVFIDALAKAGVPYDRGIHWEKDWYKSFVPHENFEQFAYMVLEKTVDSNRPDGLVVTDDTMARGAMMALLRQGIHTGRDMLMAVASNKGSPVLAAYEADLILIEHDPEELVRQILLTLEQLLLGEEPSEPVALVKPHLR